MIKYYDEEIVKNKIEEILNEFLNYVLNELSKGNNLNKLELTEKYVFENYIKVSLQILNLLDQSTKYEEDKNE